jgi:hypothetical protein
MQIVTIKRKGAPPERFFSEGTAILDVDGYIECTITQTENGEKLGAKMYLQRGDTIKIQVGNKSPKGKA